MPWMPRCGMSWLAWTRAAVHSAIVTRTTRGGINVAVPIKESVYWERRIFKPNVKR